MIQDEDIRRRLSLGEDSSWEFKQIEFQGDKPVSPKRDDLADELGAFANADGGTLLCGVADDGTIKGMSREQMNALNDLLVEVSNDTLKPPLHIKTHNQELDGRAFVLVQVPRGEAVHERGGKAFIRAGPTKRRLSSEDRQRLVQNRGQNRHLGFDEQIVPDTGFKTLDERLWERLLSVEGAADPQRGLLNLRLLKRDEAGVMRATVAGLLLCTDSPQNWLPQAIITATQYRGLDRASGQLDAQEIVGPLHKQIRLAIKFVFRNMRVSARKVPEREDVPEYSKTAVFEAVVNAVAHRDYSVWSRRIRLSLFKDRLEIDSPGQLPDGMTIEGMEDSQATRNEVIASVFSRTPVGDAAGSGYRQYLMEHRGDGVSIIRKKTEEATGKLPKYEIVDGSSLVLRIPAAKLELVGATKRFLRSEERLRLAQNREQNRHLGFDKQIVPDTSFKTLDERLWERLLSVEGAADPQRGLLNLRLLALDEAGMMRATVAGLLLCTDSPQNWLPQAIITATQYRGLDRASGQLDAQEIVGPLHKQIRLAIKFVFRNMRVSARKVPEREDVPEYSKAAVLEAVVNAVAHRDYSMSSRHIRLSLFKDRLEIDSPGQLPDGMTIEGMEASQSTRNEVIASVFRNIPVREAAGLGDRRYLMERRGDGVSIIRKKTEEATGKLPKYELVDNSNLVLCIPAAKLEIVPADVTVKVHSIGTPLAGIEVLAIFPNKTWVRTITDDTGQATLDLYTTHLPMTIYAAGPGQEARLIRAWKPNKGGRLLELNPLESGGSAIFAQSTGHIPGLSGRLQPIRDPSDRTYLYADNIAIDEGRQQPVPFRLGKPLRLTDAKGAELSVTIVDIIGRAALIEYRPFEP